MENKNKRIEEIQLCIDEFNLLMSQYNIIPKYINDPAKYIVDAYEQLLDSTIKAYIPTDAYTKIYKVASGTEISCVYVQPILHDNLKIKRRINAMLAMSLATYLLYGCLYDNAMVHNTKNLVRQKVSALLKNHLNWLIYLDTSSLYGTPTYANANFWESYSIILSFVEQSEERLDN